MVTRLRELREVKGLTQYQLATAAGLPVGALRKWECGRGKMLFRDALPLADALGVSLDELAGRQAPRPAKKGKPG